MSVLERQLVEIGRRVLETEHFGPGATMESLPEWTSLRHVLLLGEIAASFGADIRIEDAYRLDSFARLIAHLQPGIAAPAVAPVAAEAGPPAASPEFTSIGALFLARAEALGDRPFLIFPKDGLTFSYRASLAMASAAARRLAANGLERGDRLCIVLPNGPEFLILYFAAHLLGLVLVPVNPALSAAEIRFIVDNSGARLTLFDPGLAHVCLEVAALGAGPAALVDAASGFGHAVLAAEADRAAPLAPPPLAADDTAVILYTSGTTGNPKGVVLSHRNFLADAAALVAWFGFHPGTRTLCILPMFHNNGQVITLLSPLLVGGDTVILEGKSALMSFWKLIDDYRVEWTSVMPAFLAAFLEFGLKRHDSSLRGIVCGGQVLLDEVRARFEAEYGVPVFEGYGLTETTSFSSLNRFPAEARVFGSIGRALPCNRMKIVGPDGAELAAGEVGQILIKGDNVAGRYHDLPALSRERFIDGWLQTGDYGHVDADGNFFFATRLDDMIIKGGENIYPSEIENVLHARADVVECAAFGIPDPILGQDICVYVKARDAETCTADALAAHLRGRIARFKQPRHIVVINPLADLPELPKGPTRKILRRKLQDHFAARLAAAPSAATGVSA